MLKLLDVQKCPGMLPEVKSFEYTKGSRSVEFHPEGLFSEILFGPKEDPKRRTQYGYIDLHCKVLHPALFKAVHRFNSKIINVLERTAQYNFTENDELVQVEEGELNGITSIIENFDRLLDARNETSKRRTDIKNMLKSYHKNGQVFIDKCIVIPPAWREAMLDETGQGFGYRIPKCNEFYQRIIKLSIQIATLPMNNPGDIFYEIAASTMYKYVNELYDFLITSVSKKSGLVRNDILGKRIDFCGRAVIIGGSYDIKPDEIGIPYKMLVKLFEPFLLYELYNSGRVDKKLLEDEILEYNGSVLSMVTLRQILTDIQKGHVLPKSLDDIIISALKNTIKDKIVIAKRDPCLHAESVRGYKPVLIFGDAIKLAVTACEGHNADYDGDTMAVYAPMTQESMQEVKDKMMSPFSMDGMGQCVDSVSKDYTAGLYLLTKDNLKFKSIQPKIIKDDRDLETLHPNYPIIVNGEVTTVGRYMFNKIVPDKGYMIKQPLTKKIVNRLIKKCAVEYYRKDPDTYNNFVNQMIKLGAKYYTVIPVTFSLEDLVIPQSIYKLKDKLKNCKNDAEIQEIINKMEKLLKQYLEENDMDLGILGKSGALKNGYSQVRQILVAKGIISIPGGKTKEDSIEVVTHSYGEGMNSRDHFNTGYATRSGIMDRVLNTAPTGYLSRQLAYALQRVECDPTRLDCGTRRTIQIKCTDDICSRLIGRYVYGANNQLELFDADKWNGKVVKLRSPVYCALPKLCRHCYGELMLRNRTLHVGILAAQILGERLSQVSMKQFHVGGSISFKMVDIEKELTKMMDNINKPTFMRQFVWDSTKLYSKESGKIIIEKSFYKNKKDIVVESDHIKLDYGYFLIDMDSYNIDVTIDNAVDIPLDKKKVTETDTGFIIEFQPNDTLFECVPTPEIFSKKVKIIEGVFNGKSPYKSADHYVMKFYDMYKEMGCSADFVHFEVLVSNLLRDGGNPSYPARLNTKNYNPITVGLKNIPTQESWLEAFCFENSKEAITTGLLYERDNEQTIFEKLATSTI